MGRQVTFAGLEDKTESRHRMQCWQQRDIKKAGVTRLCYPFRLDLDGRVDAKRGSCVAWGPVLVCDDNLLMGEVVCEFLRECGLEPVGPVGRLESAMQMARERALDGAILDINLNGRPCFSVCAILSARRIPFVFLTGYPEASIPMEYRGAPLVSKPFDATEMKEVVAQMLGLSHGWSLPEHLRSTVRH